jgi:hypothetical protein
MIIVVVPICARAVGGVRLVVAVRHVERGSVATRREWGKRVSNASAGVPSGRGRGLLDAMCCE